MKTTTCLNFNTVVREKGLAVLKKGKITTLQINLGSRCNQECVHCHVSAKLDSDKTMSRRVAERIVSLVDASPHVKTVDITGGAPELNSNFKWLVKQLRALGRQVIDRSNLTVLVEPSMRNLIDFLATHQVHIVASLPCYTGENVDRQRGVGVFEKSIDALKRLNKAGYGMSDSGLALDLVYNPAGAFLPGHQVDLENAYKQALLNYHGIRFNRLLTMVNMPIGRFVEDGTLESNAVYLDLLYRNFNPNTVNIVMCRSLVSVDWEGILYDCDFNQMTGMILGARQSSVGATIFDIDSISTLEHGAIATSVHCFGCTAGAGSSCQGALD